MGAIATKNLAAAERLLETGAKPDATGGGDFPKIKANADFMNHQWKMTPLWLAIYMNQPAMAQLLLKFKADPDDLQTDGRPLLFSALADTNMVEALLSGGATIEAHDSITVVNGDRPNWTPLAAAAWQESATTMEILLKHGANPNFRDAVGNVALHWAVSFLRVQLTDQNRKIVELLLDHGVEPNVQNKGGYTPLDWVKMRLGQNENSSDKATAGKIADLLRQHGALDSLPDFTRIRITRQGLAQPLEVFRKGAKLTNQFTLLETVMRFYSQKQIALPGQPYRENWGALPFPDFGRVIIRRPNQKPGGKEQEIKVSLLNSSNVVDCAQDVAVAFGDVIEIPESVHALNARTPNPVGEMERAFVVWTYEMRLPPQSTEEKARAAAYRSSTLCLQKSVQLVVAGETTSFKVNSWKEGFLSWALAKTEARSVLRSSSDLSRVQVTRKTGKSAKPAIFTVDVSDSAQRNDDLWLQDGDVIEVPEKR
jgi:hypothetical protein